MDVRVIRTIVGAHLATHKTIGVPYVPLPNTTMNQKFGVFEKEMPRQEEYPYARYLAIGRDGAKYGTGKCGIPKQIPHSPEHNALYEFIPWIVRRMADDLSEQQRRGYRIRVPFTSKSGEPYVAYYLKAIDVSKVKPTVELRHVEDGKITSTTYEPDVANLSPKHIEYDPININNPNADCLISTAKVPVNLNQNDIAEIIHSFEVIDGDSSCAHISEMAVVSAVDRTMTTNINGAMGNYTEAICAEMNTFLWKYNLLDITTTHLDLVLDVGSSELQLL